MHVHIFSEQNATAHFLISSCSNRGGCSYVKHMRFINYNTFGLTNPVYVGTVRHPVERLQSWWGQIEYQQIDAEILRKKSLFVKLLFNSHVWRKKI